MNRFKKLASGIVILFLVFSFTGCESTETVSKPQKSSSSTTSEIKKQESSQQTAVSQQTTSEQASSKETVSVSGSSSSKNTVSKKPSASSQTQTVSPTVPPVTDYKFSSNIDINDNVFMDSLIYTGYNINKHRSDGLMWQYVLASQKRAKGWLSNISYGGGCTGYETVASGKPNIARFERGGLVCASYVTYLYFNYLPNVAGINTNFLTKPADPTKAHSWYLAAKQWIAQGYSREIKFTASSYRSGSGYAINFKPAEQIPIGSVMVFRDYRNTADRGSHVCVYAGYKNGHNWVYHVGNSNGPEFCSVERMGYGPDPQYPLMVITPPLNLRMAACIDITLSDDKNNPISGVSFSAKNLKTGTVYNVGTTSNDGKLTLEGMPFGNYTLTHTAKSGYTTEQGSVNITLTTANNGLNTVKITDKSTAVESKISSTTSADNTD